MGVSKMNTEEFNMDFKIMFGDKAILTVKDIGASYELKVLRNDVELPYMEHLRLCIFQIDISLKTIKGRRTSGSPKENAYIAMITQAKKALVKSLNQYKRTHEKFVSAAIMRSK